MSVCDSAIRCLCAVVEVVFSSVFDACDQSPGIVEGVGDVVSVFFTAFPDGDGSVFPQGDVDGLLVEELLLLAWVEWDVEAVTGYVKAVDFYALWEVDVGALLCGAIFACDGVWGDEGGRDFCMCERDLLDFLVRCSGCRLAGGSFKVEFLTCLVEARVVFMAGDECRGGQACGLGVEVGKFIVGDDAFFVESVHEADLLLSSGCIRFPQESVCRHGSGSFLLSLCFITIWDLRFAA